MLSSSLQGYHTHTGYTYITCRQTFTHIKGKEEQHASVVLKIAAILSHKDMQGWISDFHCEILVVLGLRLMSVYLNLQSWSFHLSLMNTWPPVLVHCS